MAKYASVIDEFRQRIRSERLKCPWPELETQEVPLCGLRPHPAGQL